MIFGAHILAHLYMRGFFFLELGGNGKKACKTGYVPNLRVSLERYIYPNIGYILKYSVYIQFMCKFRTVHITKYWVYTQILGI